MLKLSLLLLLSQQYRFRISNCFAKGKDMHPMGLNLRWSRGKTKMLFFEGYRRFGFSGIISFYNTPLFSLSNGEDQEKWSWLILDFNLLVFSVILDNKLLGFIWIFWIRLILISYQSTSLQRLFTFFSQHIAVLPYYLKQ